MKRSIFGAAALALVLSASAVQAQRPVSIGIALGATMPTGDFGDFAELGYHGMATLGFSPPALPVGLRIDGAFNQLAAKTEGLTTEDFNWRVMSLTANATFGVPMAASPISPYLIGGLGMYNFTSDVEDAEGDTNLGFNVGIGTKFALAGFGTFAEIRYHHVTGEDDPDTGENNSIAYIPISFGITF